MRKELCYADTALRGDSEVRTVGRVRKMRSHGGRVVAGSKTQVFIDAVRIYDLSGIHLPFWVPKCLEFAEGLHQLGTEHLYEKLRAPLTIAMLAGKGPAE